MSQSDGDARVNGLSQAFEIMALRDILQEAYNGLKWYRDRHPEDDSPADDELYERIERALEEPGEGGTG